MHFILIYALVWKKEKIHYVSYNNYIFEFINIDFWKIWHFDDKGGTGKIVMWVAPKYFFVAYL